jgi:hypothetical protein
MAWTPLRFGKHRGRTLPQVVFADPDYFFWGIEQGIFNKDQALQAEAGLVNYRARHIKLPQGEDDAEMVAEYLIHPSAQKFADLQMVPRARSPHSGGSPAFHLQHLDLSVPRQLSPYDKTGGEHLVRLVKLYLFGSSSVAMTRERCDRFFEDDDNFDLGEYGQVGLAEEATEVVAGSEVAGSPAQSPASVRRGSPRTTPRPIPPWLPARPHSAR